MFEPLKAFAVNLSTIALVSLIGIASPAFAQSPAETTAIRSQTPPSFAEVAKLVEPAVVSIETKSKIPEATASADTAPGDSDDILEFLRRQNSRRPIFGVGSGFIIDKGGLIITNAHVIDNVSRITVRLDSGETFDAKVLGSDSETDIAVLKISSERELPHLEFGDPDKAQVGDWVLAVGSPFGLSRSVTAGIISQKQRETPGNSAFQKFIQTDAAINRGNSGGPLVNLEGKVIGVNSQIATSTGDYNGVGFALPADETAYVYDQIVKFGRVRRGFLGVILDSVKSEFAKVYGLGDTRGAIVTEVRDKKSAAALAGLQAGDVIVEIGGKPVADAQDLIAKVAASEPERSVDFVFYRENGAKFERRSITIKLDERPTTSRTFDGDSERRPLPIDGKVEPTPFGLTLLDLTPTLAATYKLEGQKGLLVKDINPSSYVADLRAATGEPALGEGDLIQRINRISVTDKKTFNETVAGLKEGDAVVLHVLTYNARTQSPQLKIVQFTVK